MAPSPPQSDVSPTDKKTHFPHYKLHHYCKYVSSVYYFSGDMEIDDDDNDDDVKINQPSIQIDKLETNNSDVIENEKTKKQQQIPPQCIF